MRAKDKGDLYVHQDANWNVIALTDLGGSVARASCPCLHRLEADATDGDVDATDKGSVGTTCTGTVSGPCRILDLDPAIDSAGAAPRPACSASAGEARTAVSMVHGDYDNADATLFDPGHSGHAARWEGWRPADCRRPAASRAGAPPQGLARHPARPVSGVAFPFAHQGLYLDPELASYQNRARQYDPGKKRFIEADPLVYETRPLADVAAQLAAVGCTSGVCGLPGSIGYIHVLYPLGQYNDGATLYGYTQSNPLAFLDPSGRYCCDQRPCTGGPAGAPPFPCTAAFWGITGGFGSLGRCACGGGTAGRTCTPGGMGLQTCANGLRCDIVGWTNRICIIINGQKYWILSPVPIPVWGWTSYIGVFGACT